MQQIQELMELVSKELTGTADSDTVVGTPIEIGGATLVPISRLGIGLGAGGGEGEGEGQAPKRHGGRQGRGKGTGGGSGGGAKIRPVAVIAFTDDGVQVLPVPGKKGKLDQFIDKIPDWVDMFESRMKE